MSTNQTFQMLGAAAIAIVILVVLYGAPTPTVISRWNRGVRGEAQAVQQPPPANQGLQGGAQPIATPAGPGSAALESYNESSQLVESAAQGSVELFRRKLSRGEIAYLVVMLDSRTHLEVITADGAQLGSDATGDTIWRDGGRHLRTVEEMTRAPQAARPELELLGALAFGFHGDARTSDEGTVVVNGVVQRINPGRSALCVYPDRTAAIGVFDEAQAEDCAQAAGAGPILMRGGKITNPDVSQETPEFLPFNPLNEDFVQLDWRQKVFTGDYPKTMIGIGRHADGHDYLVLLASYGVSGVDAVRQLREMGCTEAIGGDDDTSTQLVWRGSQVVARQVRRVPTAIAVYAREP